MKVALVHDYLREFGGAERVLKVFSEMYPEATIWTAFFKRDGSCGNVFGNKCIKESFLAPILKFSNLYSPLRFLIPIIWKSMDLSDYDLVITSCSSYVARGFKVSKKTKVIAYCHTPPRYLYGYETSVDWKKNVFIRGYALLVNHFLRIFDYQSAQEVDCFVVNSENVWRRVKKYYRRDAVVIYPPIEMPSLIDESVESCRDYYLIVSRLVGGKGLVEAAKAAKMLNFNLKIVGESVGFSRVKEEILKIGGEVEFLGRISDEELVVVYEKAKGFIALAKDEDFGMTVVESQMTGTPVLAYNGGGFKETIVDGVTGVLIDGVHVGDIKKGLERFNKIKWDRGVIIENAKKYSRENFENKFFKLVRDCSAKN
jgi:glycosyltransferase involved in cell wall biosynthesis